ncbi:nuclease [Sistotremastrum niveocremeum HHB9708]|uniref:Nuclease n=1 Tax=Sistotremastrum niveocremeum HHB9708 TaxID=1314777 RepID=A0A164Q8S8_9AGAM|nr:nuclease [Sistotremastrum niveocremeum HHB9708]
MITVADAEQRIGKAVARLSWIDVCLLSFSGGVLSTLAGAAVFKRYVKRIPNSEWITPVDLQKRRFIRGVVTSVGDGDNFRLFHTPGLGWNWPLKVRRIPKITERDTELKDQTIHIRLAGVDAPEAAHFGREAQPYSEEALQWLKTRIEGRTVWCQLLRRDQYGRVAFPFVTPLRLPAFRFLSTRCVSLEMLKVGWAVVYDQTGAEYGKWGQTTFLKLEDEARYGLVYLQTARRGMWKSLQKLETPKEYKNRHAVP